MSNPFSGDILAEKLSKLNNSQASIETLSHWCIFHRNEANHIVKSWDRIFSSSGNEQCIALLYLANDIIQNSRRKGSEFVSEFWKVLPASLKKVYENSDEPGKKAVSRLVHIWDERKVFGSRGQSLKDQMMGKDIPIPEKSENNGKPSNPIKILKKDAHSMRIKLATGGMPEKIIIGLQSVHEEHFKESSAMNKCKAAIRRVGQMETVVDDACTQGNQQATPLCSDLLVQENMLQECVQQLENVESLRVALVKHLNDAVHDQESKLELVRTQLLVAHSQIEQAINMRQRLSSLIVSVPVPSIIITTAQPLIPQSLASFASLVSPPRPPLITITITPQPLTSMATETGMMIADPGRNIPPQPSLPQQPITTFATSKLSLTTEEGQKKAAAAAVAAKLAAMTSSAQMLTSVFSSFAAEEAAAANANANANANTGGDGGFSLFPPKKKQKLDKPSGGGGSVTDRNNSNYFSPTLPPLPPPRPTPPPPLPVNPYVQQSNMSYGYTANGLPPLPPPPPQSQLQSAAPPGFYQAGFYGQNHQQQQAPPLPR